MESYRTEDYIKAMAVMGEFKDQGSLYALQS